MYKKMIAAHRGASAYIHENTLESFTLALEMDADMIELDVRTTLDMEHVVFHDASIDNIAVDSLTYAQMQVVANRLGFYIPTLDETIKRFAPYISFDIELKENGYAQQILETILRYKGLFKRTYYIITSFDRDMIQSIHLNNQDIATGMLFSENEHDELYRCMNDPVQLCKQTDYLCLHWRLVEEDILQNTPLPIIVWTVDDKDKIKRLLLQPNISAIVTNTPDVGVKVRNEIEADAT